jgi:hypothetical protein
MKRRNFLGFMAASPLAAKQVAHDTAMKLTGVEIGGPEDPTHIHGMSHGRNLRDEKTILKKITALLRKDGIPPFRLDEIKRAAKIVKTINPDIGVLRSVSVSNKIKMQQSLNFRDGKAYFLHQYTNPHIGDREEFEKTHEWYL